MKNTVLRKYRPRVFSQTRNALRMRQWKIKHPNYNKERVEAWRQRNPDKVLAKKIKEKEDRQQDPRNQLLKAAWTRSGKKGRSFNLTLSDIVIPKVCPVLGIPINRKGTKRTPNSPSLDRINSRLGYVKGNIVVISWRANDLKKDASPGELRKLADFYAKP